MTSTRPTVPAVRSIITARTPQTAEKYTLDLTSGKLEGSYMRPGVMRAFGVDINGPTYKADGEKLRTALGALATDYLHAGTEIERHNTPSIDTPSSEAIHLLNADGGRAIVSPDAQQQPAAIRDVLAAAQAIRDNWDHNGGLAA